MRLAIIALFLLLGMSADKLTFKDPFPRQAEFRAQYLGLPQKAQAQLQVGTWPNRPRVYWRASATIVQGQLMPDWTAFEGSIILGCQLWHFPQGSFTPLGKQRNAIKSAFFRKWQATRASYPQIGRRDQWHALGLGYAVLKHGQQPAPYGPCPQAAVTAARDLAAVTQ